MDTTNHISPGHLLTKDSNKNNSLWNHNNLGCEMYTEVICVKYTSAHGERGGEENEGPTSTVLVCDSNFNPFCLSNTMISN